RVTRGRRECPSSMRERPADEGNVPGAGTLPRDDPGVPGGWVARRLRTSPRWQGGRYADSHMPRILPCEAGEVSPKATEGASWNVTPTFDPQPSEAARSSEPFLGCLLQAS